jgi:hypothetical protein
MYDISERPISNGLRQDPLPSFVVIIHIMFHGLPRGRPSPYRHVMGLTIAFRASKSASPWPSGLRTPNSMVAFAARNVMYTTMDNGILLLCGGKLEWTAMRSAARHIRLLADICSGTGLDWITLRHPQGRFSTSGRADFTESGAA